MGTVSQRRCDTVSRGESARMTPADRRWRRLRRWLQRKILVWQKFRHVVDVDEVCERYKGVLNQMDAEVRRDRQQRRRKTR